MNLLETIFDCDGTPVTVATIQESGESTADFIARHRRRVADAKKDCAGDPRPALAIQTAWRAELGEMNFSSREEVGQAAHDALAREMIEAFPRV